MVLAGLTGPGGLENFKITGISGNFLDIDTAGNMCTVISGTTTVCVTGTTDVSIIGTADVNITNANISIINSVGTCMAVDICNATVNVAGNVCFGTPQAVNVCTGSVSISGTTSVCFGTPQIVSICNANLSIINSVGTCMAVDIWNATLNVQGNVCFATAQAVTVSSGTVSISGTPSVTITSGTVAISGTSAVCFGTPQIVSICNATIAVTGNFNSETCISQTGTENTIQINAVTPSVGRLPQVGAYDSATFLEHNSTISCCSSCNFAELLFGSTATWCKIGEICYDCSTFNNPKLRSCLKETMNVSMCDDSGFIVASYCVNCNGVNVCTFGPCQSFSFNRIGTSSGAGTCVCWEFYGCYGSNQCRICNCSCVCVCSEFCKPLVCTCDFGVTSSFLKSVSLPVSASIFLNGCDDKFMNNTTGSAITLSYENPIEFSCLCFSVGVPCITVVGNTT